ncbi:uncharacterized protein LOC108155879 isoform X1 [Drosophila miranda]|uniref:uncharacterized protein LOC108155879 isoform X1 n=1 Tax=Drosophila miranda TaxID=7229 RepID=UPI0007E60410|nr:uncharacterized protein LOC108155879 isoform X1 [Drosophila miranda]XP_033244354.1 uncharacterized protein LOC108155879 isoform X1 [Drosophila miranda]XP_033244355.1 uncharacterized protein LOC108155879 isoform X1 [Drosophila miranda]XP_033244356.1 uncharacterized protein LOC108155879 isoform X1 [Drosophila miranda]XP_033244357.1 uncharacterized protein LOC108155879 isoform X1 [Drosophila miranda]XP_033244358.1 uncharacterized protein LOC108155879 isoform X1 [Drosophila miranda]
MSYANQNDNRKCGYKCIISSCLCGYRDSSTNFPVKLFTFPSDPLFFNKWVEVCRLDKNLVKRTARICERHFKPEYIGKRRLKSNAVPTLNLSPLTPLNASICNENTFSGHSVGNKPIEKPMKSKRIKLDEVHDKMSNNLEQSFADYDLNASICDENSFSDISVDNQSIEKRMKSKKINLTEMHNKVSNKLEQESETETSEEYSVKDNESKDSFEDNESIDMELRKKMPKKESSVKKKHYRPNGCRCIISSCRWGYRNNTKDSRVRLFQFPSNLGLFNKWVKACNLDSNCIKKTARICERHFQSKYIGKLRLKPEAIPTLNLSDNTLLSPLNTGICDENTSSGHKVYKTPIEKPIKSKRLKLGEVYNTISNDLEPESDSETPNDDPFEDNESIEIELSKKGRHFDAKYIGKLRLKPEAIPTLKLSDNPALKPLHEGSYGENSFLGNAEDNEPIEKPMKSKRIKLAERHNTISKDLNQESETETPDEDHLENNESIDVKCCENCIEKEKNEAYFTKKYFEILAEKRKKEEDFNKLKKRYVALKKCISRDKRRRRIRANTNYCVLPIIANMSHVSAEAKTICIMLLKKTKIFSPAEKVIAQNIHFYSKRTYEYLRDVLHLNLPTNRSLERWAVRFEPGFSPDLVGQQSE